MQRIKDMGGTLKDADVPIVRMVANDLATGWLIGSVPHCAPPVLLSNSISAQLIMMSCCLWVMALDDTALGGWPLRGERGTNIDGHSRVQQLSIAIYLLPTEENKNFVSVFSKQTEVTVFR